METPQDLSLRGGEALNGEAGAGGGAGGGAWRPPGETMTFQKLHAQQKGL